MRIELRNNVRLRLRKALRQAGHREIGGMIFAEELGPGDFRIIDFSLDATTGSRSTFSRYPELHRQALNDFFRRTGHDFTRFNYLGEWHSHPSFSVNPSRHDIATMTELVENNESISFAVLMIMRLRFLFWMDYTFTVFARGEIPHRFQNSGSWMTLSGRRSRIDRKSYRKSILSLLRTIMP